MPTRPTFSAHGHVIGARTILTVVSLQQRQKPGEDGKRAVPVHIPLLSIVRARTMIL